LFVVDAKTQGRIEPTVRRVLIADPNTHSARLLMDIVKGIGAGRVVIEPDEERAMAVAGEMEPGLVFIERSGPRLDGESLARRLRRSDLTCRQSPIIMVTADATASTIKGARDAGVHEFLRKPFTAADLFRRIENVALKPRGWVEAVGYVGPDRRRFNSGAYEGARKRQADAEAVKGAEEVAAARDQALRILKAALAQFDMDPGQAVRAMREQAQALKAQAITDGDKGLAAATAELEALLRGTGVSAAVLSGPVTTVLAIAEPEPLARAG
jgi:DNA-binding response OmpR family regulator